MDLFNESSNKRLSYQSYHDQMDIIVPQKFNQIKKYIKSGIIVDIGCGSGKLTHLIAQQFPDSYVYGIDLRKETIKDANKKYKLKNLSFMSINFNKIKFHIDTIIFCSVLHEIYSYSTDKENVIENTFKWCFNSLKQDGHLIIRDFIKPEHNIMCHLYDSEQRFKIFVKDFKMMKIKYKEIDPNHYLTDIESIYEYILHKDYTDNWDAEMMEKYGYITAKKLTEYAKKNRFKIIYQKCYHNQWIINNRLKNKIMINDREIYPYYGTIFCCRKI